MISKDKQPVQDHLKNQKLVLPINVGTAKFGKGV